jgi:signal transduction histidine kinase
MPPGEALTALDRQIQHARDRCDRAALTVALVWKGLVLGSMGHAQAQAVLRAARGLARRHGEPALRGRVLLAQAQFDADRGFHASALAACREAGELASSERSPARLRQALFTSGASLCHLGEHDLALEAFHEARMLLRSEPQSLAAHEHDVAAGRYAAAMAQAWLMRGGLLLEAGGDAAAADAFRRSRELGEEACTLLLGASPRYAQAALFGLVRVLLERNEADGAREWVSRVRHGSAATVVAGSLPAAQATLIDAMIALRAGDPDLSRMLERLEQVEQIGHPRVVQGDLRLSLLRCQFEALEACGRFRDAMLRQQAWWQTKARLRARVVKEHGEWAAQERAALRAEADDFIGRALREPLLSARRALAGLAGANPELMDHARRADHSIGRAVDIADQYLGVVRAEHLRHEELQLVDMSALVDDVCDQVAWPDGAVRLERVVVRGALVKGDRLLLMRALGNLISNAFKHAPAGSAVRVLLELHGTRVVLSVADSGPGMSLDVRARIFQRFATGAVRKGNGLGLAMVARAARVHEARISVDSEPHRGTRVALSLALAAQELHGE